MTTVDTDSPAGQPANQPSGARVAPRRHAVFHELRVSELEHLTADSIAITFEVPPELREDYRFIAGQHVSLRCRIAGDDVRRNYSICTPASSGVLRVGVKRLPDGVFSGYALEKLRVGDPIEVLTPSGRFFTPLDPAQAKHYAAVAAGSGITPILSILATALEVEPASRATLVYVNQTTASIMFLEELADLKDRYTGRFQLVHVLDRERQEVELLSGYLDRGRLTALLDSVVDTDSVDEWFLCGPLGLTELVSATLVGRGVAAGRVHRELFHAGPPPRAVPAVASAAPPGSEVTVLLDGRTATFTLRPDAESILDAALRVRGDAPYACKNGVCGTCRAKLVSGRVAMDQNFALERDEVDRGYVLACQAHPATDQVTLDFDQ
jgi:ring-1,2-phenylacetyl-CoA epoxidase subunit PaaE